MLSGGPWRFGSSAHLVIGVLEELGGRGIGGALLDEAACWAASAGHYRLELTVMAHNERAIRLYETKGFVREGKRTHSLRVQDPGRLGPVPRSRRPRRGAYEGVGR